MEELIRRLIALAVLLALILWAVTELKAEDKIPKNMCKSLKRTATAYEKIVNDRNVSHEVRVESLGRAVKYYYLYRRCRDD